MSGFEWSAGKTARRAGVALVPAALVALAAWTGQPPRVTAVVDLRGGYLVGGTAGGRWMSGDSLQGRVRTGERYRVIRGGRVVRTATGQRPRPMDDDVCSETYTIPIAQKAEEDELAVNGAWNLFPRPVARLDPSSAVYREAVRAMLVRGRIRAPQVRITGLWRADLDGDGRDEVIVSATRGRADRGINVDAGDYSLVFVRKVVNGAVRTLPLVEEYHTRTSSEDMLTEHTVGGVLDLDGDGTMEIVVRSNYYEGGSTGIYRVRGAEAREVAATGCGV
jgi:hypothetical protein